MANKTYELSDEILEKCYNVSLELVQKAGKIMRVHENPDYDQKANDIDLVTEVDKAVEKLLIEGLKSEFPTHRFIGEEQSADGESSKLTDEPTWIIDPVDGTMNFVHNFPHSCISVGFTVNKIPTIGIIFNPYVEQLFTARIRNGAYLNGKRIFASKQKELSKSLISSEFGTSRDPDKVNCVFENMRKIVDKTHGVRMLGSCALNVAMVALGGVDAHFEFGIHAWDICAAAVIVTEANGVVMDPSGGPLDLMSRRFLAAGTPELANSLASLLTQYYPQPRDDSN